MKLQKLSCPNCEGTLNIDIKDQKQIFCPYCGQKFIVDDGKKEYTINKNINISKNVTHTRRTIDEAGLISAGSYEDYEGENYEAVIEQLETLGFENITTVDLNDAGIAIWKTNKVDSISIGGDTTFYSSDYFEPDVTIIIKYH